MEHGDILPFFTIDGVDLILQPLIWSLLRLKDANVIDGIQIDHEICSYFRRFLRAFKIYVESKGQYVNFVFNDDVSSYPPGFCIHLDDHVLFSSRDDCIRLLLLTSSDVIFGCEYGACDNVIGCARPVNE